MTIQEILTEHSDYDINKILNELIDETYLSEYLSISKSSLYRYRKYKGLPFYKIKGRIMYDFKDVGQFYVDRKMCVNPN